MPSSLFPQGLIGSLGFLRHFGNVKCYISAKYHYLELPPSPQHAGAADAGEKWPAGKTPDKLSVHVLPWCFTGKMFKQQKGDLNALSSLLTETGAIPNTGGIQCKGSMGAEVQLSCWQHRRGTAPCLSYYLKSVAALNHTSKHPTRTTGVFLWALHWTNTTPVSHQAESIFTGETRQQDISKPLHHPAHNTSLKV